MSEIELKEFIKNNLEIVITRFDTGYLSVQLKLQDQIISEDSIDVPDFVSNQATPEWMR